MRMRALRANVSRMVSSKVAEFWPLDVSTIRALERCQCLLNSVLHRLDNIRAVRQQTFSPLLTRQTPALFPQPTIGRLLNGSPYGHLHIKQPPRYTVNRTQIYRAIQWACCLSVYSFIERAVFPSLSTVIKHTTGHVASRPQPVGSLPLAQKCLALH